MFVTPEFRKLAEALYKAGEEEEKWRKATLNMEEEMARLGYPAQGQMGGVGGAPFDFISDFLRGMRGSMLDLYRNPDKLLAACDKVLEWRLERGVPADPTKRGNPKRVFIALHRGSDGFMSKKQFETFYWPGLKKILEKTIELGFVPIPFCEGKWDSRLEYLRELPKGKVIYRFAETDMAKAKEVLGDHSCIMGNVPVSLLQAGTVSEVEDYCKNLIKICGKGGGFIMTASSASIEGSKPENVKAMVESVKKYGAN
jgi:uroporphyrinogen-III decarboxylase